MSPVPERILKNLLDKRLITNEQAQLGQRLPLAHSICVEADSAGHTDRGNAYVLIPAMLVLREKIANREKYSVPIRIGAAGGSEHLRRLSPHLCWVRISLSPVQ